MQNENENDDDLIEKDLENGLGKWPINNAFKIIREENPSNYTTRSFSSSSEEYENTHSYTEFDLPNNTANNTANNTSNIFKSLSFNNLLRFGMGCIENIKPMLFTSKSDPQATLYENHLSNLNFFNRDHDDDFGVM